MAFDGLSVYTIAHELNNLLADARIDKIHQPERDELIMAIRSKSGNKKLLLSCSSSNPRIHLTAIKKNNPAHPPMFCMLLRKHLAGGKILSVHQIEFDRIIAITIENKNEMGDLCKKRLIIEIMGKHSNIILVDDVNKVIDSVKHITPDISSVRVILPGVLYSLPPHNKLNPMELNNEFNAFEEIKQKSAELHKGIYQTFNGISPQVATEILSRSQLDGSIHCSELTEVQFHQLFTAIKDIMNKLHRGEFDFSIYIVNGKMIDFSSIPLTSFTDYSKKTFDDFSTLLEYYYREKDQYNRLKQKSYDLRKMLHNNIERCYKKKNIQVKQLKDTKNREQFKLYGELITAHIYAIQKGDEHLEAVNYYSEEAETVSIPLNPNFTPSENAQAYYKKYNKAKRTEEATIIQLKQTSEEIDYLESLMTSVEMAENEQDLIDIRRELYNEGYGKKPKEKGRRQQKSNPLKFVTSEGIEGYVGKNNTQNDQLTFKTAASGDLWFHTKDIPGSHVILRSNLGEYTEQSIYEAAIIAAYYSKAKNSSTVPVDYTEKRHVKKPNGSKPGFVIYFQQKTLYVTPEAETVNQLIKSEM